LWFLEVGHGCVNENAKPPAPPAPQASEDIVTQTPDCTGFTGTPIGAYDPEYSADNNWIGNYQGGDIVTYEGCEFEAEWDTI